MAGWRILLSALLASALLAGCAPRETEVVKVVDWQPPTWVGCTLDDVVAVWGEDYAHRREADSVVLEFKHYEPVRATQPSPPVPGRLSSPVRIEKLFEDVITPPRYDPTVTIQARFWIDREGVVERSWIAPELLEGSRNPPPASCSR